MLLVSSELIKLQKCTISNADEMRRVLIDFTLPQKYIAHSILGLQFFFIADTIHCMIVDQRKKLMTKMLR